jgi:hypothetical protein
MSASGQSWKQEVSVPCVRSPVTALTRRMHPLRFAGRFGKANRLLECRLCESDFAATSAPKSSHSGLDQASDTLANLLGNCCLAVTS